MKVRQRKKRLAARQLYKALNDKRQGYVEVIFQISTEDCPDVGGAKALLRQKLFDGRHLGLLKPDALNPVLDCL